MHDIDYLMSGSDVSKCSLIGGGFYGGRGDCEMIRPPPMMWPGDGSYPSEGGVVLGACM